MFILDSEKELYRKSVNCNGTQMSLKRFNGETDLNFKFPDEAVNIHLSDDELELLYNRIYSSGFSVCDTTQLGISMTEGIEGFMLTFLFTGKQDHETIKVYLNSSELKYLQILLTEKL